MMVLSATAGLAACGVADRGDAAAAASVAPGAAPNVLIVLVDTLRADHLGLYGYGRATSPFLDEIAGESVVFERAVAPSSYTRESVTSLFQGRYPSHNAWGAGWNACPDPTLPGLGGLFRQAGYHTALFSLTPMLEGLTFYEGFDEAECLVSSVRKADYSASGQGPKLAARFSEFLSARPEKPFLAYLHFLDPHAEYDPPAEILAGFPGPAVANPVKLYNELRFNVPTLAAEGFGPGDPRFEDVVRRYDAEIAHIDQSIREVFAQLERSGVDKNTIVVITADHGEEFLEHGFVEHAWQLYWESVHVPLLVWAPGRLAAGRAQTPVSLVDVLPTLLALCGGDAPDGLDGRALFTRAGEAWRPDAADRMVFSELLIQGRPLSRMVFDGRHAYLAADRKMDSAGLTEAAKHHKQALREIEAGTRPLQDPWTAPAFEAIFDMEADPGQTQDVAGNEADMLAAFRQRLAAFKEKAIAPVPDAKKQPGLPQDVIDRMKALGYLEGQAPAVDEEE